MIHAKITLKEIQYETSFANLFPMGIKKLGEIENPNIAVRFLKKMGDVSMTAALGILNRMDEKSKGELLCELVNLYCREIQAALNALLQKDELGRNICIGDLYVTQDLDGQLSLIGKSIRIDYSGLMGNDAVKQKIGSFAGKTVKKSIFGGFDLLQKAVEEKAGAVAELAVGVAPQMVEKKLLSVMSKEENKDRFLHMAEQVLEERGLCVKLEDFVFVQETFAEIQGEVIVREAKERKFELSPALEEELLNAVVGYLKMLLEE